MKKIFMAIAFVAMLMLPLMAFSMSQVSDSDLSTVTGQSGVSVNLDVSMDLHADTIAWGDADGIGSIAGTGGGWVGLSSLDASGIRVRLRQDLGNLANGYKAAMVTQGGIMTTQGGIMYTQGAIMTTQGGIMYTQGGIMTTQGAIMTTQGAIMGTEYAVGSVQTVITGAGGSGTNMAVDLATPAVIAALSTAAGGGNTDAGALLTAAGTYNTAEGTYSAAATSYGAAQATYNPAATSYSGAVTTYDAAATAYTVAETGLTTTLTGIKPLTIDVATGTKESVSNVTYVHIGTGSLEIGMTSLVANVGLGNYVTGNAPNLTQTLGSIYLGGLLANVNGSSYIDIYKDPTASSTGAGVAIGLNLTVDNITMAALSWGDADGAPYISTDYQGSVSTTAGYVGLKNVDIENLTVAGAVHINVATTTHTFVRISFANLGIGMTSMDADVVTAANAALTTNPGTLGSLYLSNLSLTLTNGQVDISAPTGSMGVVLDLGVVANATLGTLAWGDKDGVSGDPEGWVGIKNLTINHMVLGGQVTLNVATDATYVVGATNLTYVRVGLNAFSISMTSMQGDVALGASKTNLNQTLGSFYLGNLHNMAVNGSLDLHVGNSGSTVTQGVVLNFNNVTVASLTIDSLSWGDIDGIGGGSSAGYVGLKDLNITNLVISGPVSIDVATIRASASDNYQLYGAVNPIISPSFVHIGLGSGIAGGPSISGGVFTAGTLGIQLGAFAADAKLASDKTLTTAAGTLGKLFVGNLMVGMNGWVDIGAH